MGFTLFESIFLTLIYQTSSAKPREVLESKILTYLTQVWCALGCTCFVTCPAGLWQGEKGPPSLEHSHPKDLFPQKEPLKELETLQVSAYAGLGI